MDIKYKRYSRPLMGQSGETFIVPAVAVTTDENIGDFVANAVAGEIGIYLDRPGQAANRIGTGGSAVKAATVAGDVFYIVQKSTTSPQTVRKSTSIAFNDCTRKAVDHLATQYQRDTITITATANATADYFAIKLIDIATRNTPYPVEEYAFKSITAAETTEQIIDGILKDYDGKQNGIYTETSFYYMDRSITATRTAFASGNVSVTQGSNVITFPATDTTGVAYVKFNNIAFKVVSGQGAGSTSLVLDRVWSRPSAVLAHTNANTGTYATVTAQGIIVEAKLPQTTFKTVVTDDLFGFATIANTTAWRKGEGLGYIVKWLEEEGSKFAGNNVFWAERPDFYGTPTVFANEDKTYDMILINVTRKQDTKGNPEPDHFNTYPIVIAIETTTPGTSGSTQYTALKAQLGL